MSKDLELNYETLNKEWEELYDNYSNLSNYSYRLNLYDDSLFGYLEENTMMYIFEDIGAKEFVLDEYKEKGYDTDETIGGWVSGYWSPIEVILNMFKKSDYEMKEKIIQCFSTSIQVHLNSDLDFTTYEKFESIMKLQFNYQPKEKICQ